MASFKPLWLVLAILVANKPILDAFPPIMPGRLVTLKYPKTICMSQGFENETPPDKLLETQDLEASNGDSNETVSVQLKESETPDVQKPVEEKVDGSSSPDTVSQETLQPLESEQAIEEILKIVPETDRGVLASEEQRTKIDGLLEKVENLNTNADTLSDERIFGNYNVAYVSTGKAPSQKGNPAGGGFRGKIGRKFFQTTAVFQHLVAPNQVINMVQFKMLGRFPGCTTLMGTFEKINVPDLPNAVRAKFQPPRVTIGSSGKFTLQIGPQSQVTLGTPYVDDKVRVGRGGRGSLFLFTRDGPAQMEQAELWRKYSQVPAINGKVLGVMLMVLGLTLGLSIARSTGIGMLVAGVYFFFSKGGILSDEKPGEKLATKEETSGNSGEESGDR
uniref:Plastid lipid-associated protein/fibrillin conserved domain-containing protein n=1 Tax=Fibrocapsa japonica TaxID=94617 RepID=A0A7S2Y058_9STRA|mmetsp:Transcript_4295/g.6433  ORF Transcript_4295/g.6433 Transcript_4295/m.6433 type:complete len:390 (+) Transcript_4295:22-1191(+)|eukprot:CAMPEP_0113944122 /NCGR_PEP_ID=MMETSP1339-20121228/30649_1 /TAXON_ID=94617 /ORGANISM="Fibrocapsa japonica" /LENGTH=389 /DNA_ID=CAMNT_0000949197 /DNA_START=22 /DNA_END=1191 /DNA_ORIENTATION=+ /assembly_acc=CAM_ASM_000762